MTEQNSKKNRTSVLLQNLFTTPDLENFIELNAQSLEVPAFHTYITDICIETGKIPAQVIKQSAIERTYGHQLFNGTRKPSRDKVIQLAFGLQMDLDETQKLLQIAQKSILYPKIKRDAAIIHCILNKKDIYETQAVLEGLGATLLGGETT